MRQMQSGYSWEWFEACDLFFKSTKDFSSSQAKRRQKTQQVKNTQIHQPTHTHKCLHRSGRASQQLLILKVVTRLIPFVYTNITFWSNWMQLSDSSLLAVIIIFYFVRIFVYFFVLPSLTPFTFIRCVQRCVFHIFRSVDFSRDQLEMNFATDSPTL